MSSPPSAVWTKDSWRQYPVKQQPQYKDEEALRKAAEELATLPPLVHPHECSALREQLAAVLRGQSFLLWGGSCAERFSDANPATISSTFSLLLKMSLIITYISRMSVAKVARLAGQYGKPRSSPMETLENGRQVPSYKGDMVNGVEIEEREPDPQRMVEGYFRAAATLNYLRTLNKGGEASLRAVSDWKLDSVLSPYLRAEYERVTSLINDAVDFFDTIHAAGRTLNEVDLWTSHEGLLMEFEQAMTRDDRHGVPHNLGAHIIWIGDRTRQVKGGHIEYFRGIANPIAFKCGPSMTVEDLVELVNVLNPNKVPGKLAIITRYGARNVRDMLPAHIKAVQETGVPVVWVCDPCHGNTETTVDGRKTRSMQNMVTELVASFEVHRANGSRLMGCHIELTGENVTECIGGAAELGESHLAEKYESSCDPRLNYAQSLDMAFRIGLEVKKDNPKMANRN